jgi:hypothetical protein
MRSGLLKLFSLIRKKENKRKIITPRYENLLKLKLSCVWIEKFNRSAFSSSSPTKHILPIPIYSCHRKKKLQSSLGLPQEKKYDNNFVWLVAHVYYCWQYGRIQEEQKKKRIKKKETLINDLSIKS